MEREKLILKYETLQQAVDSFEQAIKIFDNALKIQKERTGREAQDFLYIDDFGLNINEVVLGLRDSVIQRFEYSVDLLWKYLKVYLEEIQGISLEVSSPKNIIRTCAKIGFLDENESLIAQEMIEQRNMTSHIYREEIAQTIISQINTYYSFINQILEKGNPQ